MAPTPHYCAAGCGELVLHAKTEAMRIQELNLRPDPDGNTAVRIDHQDNVFARGLRRGEEPAPFERVHMPHKATCRIEQEARAQRARQSDASVTAMKCLARGPRDARRGSAQRPPVTGIRHHPWGKTR